MEDRVWAREMALYNKWQNETLFGVCAGIGTADYMEKGAPEGPFEPSVQVWPDFQSLRGARERFDRMLVDLTETKPPAWLSEPVPLTSEGFGPGRSFPRQYLMMQLFNHGTHHRSQVTAELHKMGLAYGNTDIPFNPHSLF